MTTRIECVACWKAGRGDNPKFDLLHEKTVDLARLLGSGEMPNLPNGGPDWKLLAEREAERARRIAKIHRRDEPDHGPVVRAFEVPAMIPIDYLPGDKRPIYDHTTGKVKLSRP